MSFPFFFRAFMFLAVVSAKLSTHLVRLEEATTWPSFHQQDARQHRSEITNQTSSGPPAPRPTRHYFRGDLTGEVTKPFLWGGAQKQSEFSLRQEMKRPKNTKMDVLSLCWDNRQFNWESEKKEGVVSYSFHRLKKKQYTS